MPTPPYLRRAENPDKGVAGRKAEKSLAKRLQADLTPGSGAIQSAKGDMKKAEFIVENKSTQRDSFTLKLAHLHKIYQESLQTSMTPALAFQFVNSQGQSGKRDRWVCIPESLFNELTGEP